MYAKREVSGAVRWTPYFNLASPWLFPSSSLSLSSSASNWSQFEHCLNFDIVADHYWIVGLVADSSRAKSLTLFFLGTPCSVYPHWCQSYTVYPVFNGGFSTILADRRIFPRLSTPPFPLAPFLNGWTSISITPPPPSVHQTFVNQPPIWTKSRWYVSRIQEFQIVRLTAHTGPRFLYYGRL